MEIMNIAIPLGMLFPYSYLNDKVFETGRNLNFCPIELSGYQFIHERCGKQALFEINPFLFLGDL